MGRLFRPLSPFERLLELAVRGAGMLDETARDEIRLFLRNQQQPDGGFRGRAGASDLYYSLFALAGLRALGTSDARSDSWLAGFGSGGGLDLVHLSSLAVCRGLLAATSPDSAWISACAERLERFRQPDGGFRVADDGPGTPYGGYLAVLATGALGLRLERRRQVVAAAERCRASDGGYAERPNARQGTVPGTAAALVLRASGWRLPRKETGSWFETCRRPDGFAAAPGVPDADLLSTATVLATNRLLLMGLAADRSRLAAFVESCWTAEGGFGAAVGSPADCEYTFYALLALGALA